jgi:NAD(P)-dependent dehydrogenase (short-subunit alcohol dehydrogenase family)
MEPLQNRVCLVTGAGHGIGRAIAVELARQGAAGVVIADLDSDAGTATSDLVREIGSDSSFVDCDLRDLAQIEAAVASTVDQFGQLDVLFRYRRPSGTPSRTSTSRPCGG